MKNVLGVRLESPAFEAGTVLVAEVTGREAISQLFEIELRLATREGVVLDEEKLMTSFVTLVFERSTSDTGAATDVRRISGTVRSLLDRALSESRHREYVVTLVPRVWQASLTSTSDVCMDLSIPEIIQSKLVDGASLDASLDLELRLKGTYGPRELVVQYKETNLAFASRLAEDLGISFFFEEGEDGREVMVFADDNSAFKPSTPETAPFHGRGDKTDVYELEARRQLVTKSFVARDYNYRNPAMDVLGEANTTALGSGRFDEYGPHAKTPEEATFYAKVRAQESQARSLTYEGRSELPGLRAGSVLVVEGHPRGELEIVVTEVEHRFAQQVFGFGDASEHPYENRFRAIPRSSTYRPARLTPKPVVHGMVTGIVEAASPTSLGAIDEQGRYRVSFLYDSVTGRGDGKASRPLRMAQPSAGDSRGFHLPLKTGTEVLITCVNGDPDRPIIAGAVPNPQTPSPVTAANAEKSMWKTNVNSIAIDDDQPRCKISVAGEDHVLQIGQPNGPEEGILLETKKNITLRSKTESTWHSKELSLFTEKNTAVVTKDILVTAGVPTFKSKWEKLEEVAESAAEFGQSMASKLDKVAEQLTHARKEAEEKKTHAVKAVSEAQKAAREGMGVKEKAHPKPVMTPQGPHYETQEQAEQRTFEEEIAKPENERYARGITQAMYDAAEATKELEDFDEHTATGEVTAARKEIKEAIDTAHEELESFHDKYKKYAPYADKVKKAAESVKGLGPLIKKLPSAEALFSKLGALFSKASHQAIDATVTASQKVSNAVPKASGQRRGDDVGVFKAPYNIQASYNSAALYGWKNAFVFGGKNVTLFSAKAVSALGRQRVDVKSANLVEVSAKDVVLSAKKEIDAYSDGTVAIVAKSKGIKVPAEASIMVNGQKDVHLVSDDKSVHLKANENISLFAQQGNTTVTTKKDLLVLVKDGKIDIEAQKGPGKLHTKQKLEVSTKDDLLLSAEKKGTIRIKDDLKLNSKSGHWKMSGELEIKSSKLAVKAKKIELG